MKLYPALDVQCESPDELVALVDDFSPTAIEERDDSSRVFFANTADRDAARFIVASRFPVASIDVSDEDWARRSQENLQPITIGRLTIVPVPASPNPKARPNPKSHPNPESRIPNPEAPPNPETNPNPESRIPNPDTIVIVPSMGFGTGHHATTRLCLEMLQALDLTGRFVLDIGTGSGVLAIAAVRLGARRAIGIDNDPDAIQAARENLAHNPDAGAVSFEVADLASFLTAHRGEADVVAANLTGALLQRTAVDIERGVQSGGSIVASGILAEERAAVAAAFASSVVVRDWAEDEWVGLLMKRS